MKRKGTLIELIAKVIRGRVYGGGGMGKEWNGVQKRGTEGKGGNG